MGAKIFAAQERAAIESCSESKAKRHHQNPLEQPIGAPRCLSIVYLFHFLVQCQQLYLSD